MKSFRSDDPSRAGYSAPVETVELSVGPENGVTYRHREGKSEVESVEYECA